MPTLRNGQETQDLRLDRLVEFDPRSRDYPITAALGTARPRSFTWRGGPVTDQGAEGACVGHGWTGELTARPVPVAIPHPESYAYSLYHDVQHIDPWAGCSLGTKCKVAPSPDSTIYHGTSVLTAAQTLQERGFITNFRWAFGLDDLVLALGNHGPAVLGIPWYDSMYEAPGGKVTVSGNKVGGHCILARGVSLKREAVLLRNSWGSDWGIGGDAWISFEALAALLKDDGEACIPTRSTVRTA